MALFKTKIPCVFCTKFLKLILYRKLEQYELSVSDTQYSIGDCR